MKEKKLNGEKIYIMMFQINAQSYQNGSDNVKRYLGMRKNKSFKKEAILRRAAATGSSKIKY